MIKDKTMIALGSFLESKTKSLKSLAVSFSGPSNEISDKGLIALSKGLEKHQELKKLDLRFKYPLDISFPNLVNRKVEVGITDEGLQELAKPLSLMKNLEFFFINLSEGKNKCSGAGFEAMVQALRSSKKLHTIMLYFWGGANCIGPESLAKTRRLFSKCKCLKTLEISTGGGVNECSDESFTSMTNSFKDVFTLNSLSLFFT
jgi:hypothetical protein